MKTGIMACLSVLLANGCASESPIHGTSPELRELGITRLAIVETDTRLTIEGRGDDDKMPLATVALDLGTFYMEEDDRGVVSGRRLQVTGFDVSARHESAGYEPLTLPFPRGPRIAEFLDEPSVTAVLLRWGIGFDETTKTTMAAERAYTVKECAEGAVEDFGLAATSCQVSGYSGCTASEKLKWYKSSLQEWGEWRCCQGPDPRVLAERACKGANESTSCGTAGPGGCKVCWQQQISTIDDYCDLQDLGSQCRYDACIPPP